MTAQPETLNNALLISLEALFDESHRAKLMPQTETGDVKAALMDAYFDGFIKDPATPLMWQVRAWLNQGYPVAIVSKLPERLRPVVHQRLKEALPELDWSEWPLHLSLHMADYRAGFYGSAVLMEAIMQCKDWGGVAIAQIGQRNAESVRKWFPNAVINAV